jgi:hypothetical protein
MHIGIASKLDCKATKVRRAIQQLISEGKWNVQKDGVVYGPDGKVLSVDPERVPYKVEDLNATGHRLSAEHGE